MKFPLEKMNHKNKSDKLAAQRSFGGARRAAARVGAPRKAAKGELE
jgi:hypothetical protein